tara:strand:- start:4396 stop:4737 length:342 start_codon:yes stop_codon:yes gene_type:complete
MMGNVSSRWNIETYNAAKKQMVDSIHNDTNTIILYGSGGNGKSHLTAELKEMLHENDYLVYSCDDTYSWSKDDFIKDMNNKSDKKLQHFLFNPIEKWDIVCHDQEIKVINMGI